MEQRAATVHPVTPIRRTDDHHSPRGHWLLEGGDDRWEELSEAIRSRLDDVIAGGVLEVISWSPGIELNVAAWCAGAGHELLEVVRDGTSSRLRIRKGDGSRNDAAPDTGRDG